MYVRPDLYYSQTIEHLSNWYSCRALDLALYSAWRSRMLNLLREAFFWFPSTQGRENGRVGDKNVKPQVNAAPKRWTTKTDQKSPVQNTKNAIFSPSKWTGGLTGTKKGFRSTPYVNSIRNTLRYLPSCAHRCAFRVFEGIAELPCIHGLQDRSHLPSMRSSYYCFWHAYEPAHTRAHTTMRCVSTCSMSSL